MSSAFSEWLEIICGVPQGSILGPLLFNIFINDIFLFIYETELCNFADDNTIYASDKHIDNVLTKLKNELRRLLKWFANNSMVANKEKFQLMFLGAEKDVKYEDLSVTIDKIVIKATENVKLLGIDIDNKLKFTTHIEKMCSKVNSKTNALRRIRKYLTVDKGVTLFNAFILSNFNYCPIIWMFCRKSANVVINKAHKKALRVVYNKPQHTLDELLKLNKGSTIHAKNLRTLMCEIYKCLHEQNPEFMWELIKKKDNIRGLRASNILHLPSRYTKSKGTNTLYIMQVFVEHTTKRNNGG